MLTRAAAATGLPCLAAALLAAAGCGAPAPAGTAAGRLAQPVTHSTADDGDSAIVALVDGGGLRCTGALIAARVVLTAAHCLGGSRDAWPRVDFGAGLPGTSALAKVLDARPLPGFAPSTLEDDLALLLLDAEAPADRKPAVLSEAPLSPADEGRAVRVVGYGLQRTGDSEPARRRQGNATIEAVDGRSFTVAGAPSQPCAGDSGGPAFLTVDGVERLVGVTSSGDPDCQSFARETRVDLFVSSFIRPYLAAAAPGAAAGGERCAYDLQCAAGACAAAEDDARLRYCSPSCAGDGECPQEMSCRGGACRFSGSTPGAFAGPCSSDGDCVTGRCGGGGERRCTVRCFSDLAGTCPAGYACAADPERAGEESCSRALAPGGGCQAVRGGPGAVSSRALMALLGALALRRGRSRPRAPEGFRPAAPPARAS